MGKNEKRCSILRETPTKKGILYFSFGIGILAIFILIFILVADEMEKKKLVKFDDSVSSILSSHISPVLTQTMEMITFFGSGWWLIIGALAGTVILFMLKKWSLGIFLIFSSCAGILFNILLKNIFQRQRPDLHRLISANGYSFPSGHSMGSMILYGAVAYIIIHYAHLRIWKIVGTVLMALFILLIGISRIYLGVHFPSDIVGGYAAGGAWLVICILSFRYYEDRKNL